MMRKSMLAMALCAATLCGVARGDDTSSLKEELADLKAKVASMESARMEAAAGGDCGSLVSMKKKGRVKIGGDIKVDVIVLHRDDITSADDEIDSTRFSTGEPYGAYLDFQIQATPDSFLFVKLDLDDAWDEAAGQDDLLAECYFMWENIGCNGEWSFLFGKKEFVDYGQDKYLGITPSFHDGWAYWMIGQEAFDPADSANPHATIGSNTMPTAPYRTFQVEAIWAYRDLLTVSGTVFQNNHTTGGGRNTRGMHEDRSDDHMPESFAAKMEVMPLECLSFEVSFCNWHTDSYGERQLNPAASLNPRLDPTDDMQAVSVGFDYDPGISPINIFGEYQHGWNWGYVDEADVDVAQLGLIYGACENIDLGVMGEWARISELANAGDDEEYWQVVANATYHLDSGIYMMIEYAHVWYDYDGSSVDMDRDADMIGFRTGWQF